MNRRRVLLAGKAFPVILNFSSYRVSPAFSGFLPPVADGIIGGGCFQKFIGIFDGSGNRLLLKQIQE